MAEDDSSVFGVYRGWFIVAACFIIWTVVFGIQYSFGIFFKTLQESLGCSRGAISWAMSFHLIAFALAMLPVGWAIERFNIRIVYSLAAFAVGISLALCSRVSEPWQLYLLYGLFGFSAAIVGPSIFTVIAHWFEEKRGLAMGLASAGSGFGSMVMAPLTNSLMVSYGWRETFLILGLASFVTILICAQCIKSTPETATHKTVPAARKSADDGPASPPNLRLDMTFAQAIRTREILFIIIASATAQMTSRATVVHLAPYAIDIGISSFMAAMALSTIGLGGVLGRIAMGFVQDRIGARRSIIICLLTMAVCLLALPFVKSDMEFFIFAILFGSAFGGDVPQIPALTAQCFGVASMGFIYAVVAGTANIAASLGPISAGYLFDMTHSYTAAFIGAGLLLFLGIWSVSRIK